jgi:hypothetical protein
VRSTPRRWLAALGILTAASALSVFGPARAWADTGCYKVYVGSDAATVCPWG